MKRSLTDIEYEIVDQILMSEICLDICKEVPIIPGRGADFLPYFYNLNFSKAAISLHSLLLSKQRNEISIENFISQYKEANIKKDISSLEQEIGDMRNLFEAIFPMPLRHKVFAHLDTKFKHSDFFVAYTVPGILDKYISLVEQLKKCFFKFVNHMPEDYPYGRILEQSRLFIKQAEKKSEKYEF